jgi:hypothetical protein
VRLKSKAPVSTRNVVCWNSRCKRWPKRSDEGADNAGRIAAIRTPRSDRRMLRWSPGPPHTFRSPP